MRKGVSRRHLSNYREAELLKILKHCGQMLLNYKKKSSTQLNPFFLQLPAASAVIAILYLIQRCQLDDLNYTDPYPSKGAFFKHNSSLFQSIKLCVAPAYCPNQLQGPITTGLFLWALLNLTYMKHEN